jgi:hypothetical protein
MTENCGKLSSRARRVFSTVRKMMYARYLERLRILGPPKGDGMTKSGPKN